ncbi:MAG: uroporphyrinogen-III C-methyltransferase [Nitrospirae bacterium CG_4_10_14_3_um_filter_44_29]|nr:uroporphyrinogen-III C-methyltransferase [Nitrospirota bacterium]OIO30483.1 MAG: uroporphyrinogen-III C-methyltransferase [Nitrospirae bacterium CG1_02_44_142]PIP70072.1 MAG: uroporphyrinogen-III C-methyltransferase [Nitrospirae bacterium CG22_combo_CG10-13_8_21_14_all_44_11]PIV43994.1 MAG: uroporphyrinogen-III C-methyltransferase [Nitrospirae bacterium CG02_land_8_20_14_3_00_44_33]PIV67458.1 MAG: uroporphyrinogen-III C-methyltransferase [Nitrospirae bacterium CG01_land_8_20_14_3_00_44_22]P
MNEKKGRVYLVGAGPGDIGLLTVKGMKCLQRADAVIYDFHLNAQVLNYIKHDAEFIYAGKRGGHHTMTQDRINKVLVEKAKEGKVVCRLKGGDPFVFGRGGEEAEALAENNIDFEVVPGVSSAVAAPAYAGIPITHRGYSSSFAVIPGYEDTTKKESAIDWAKLATGAGTLIFLMAVKNMDVLVKKLMENGRSPDTPVAVIRWGTRPDQKTITGVLRDIAGIVREKDIKPPAVMVIGEVVKLRDRLMWYEKKPMFGLRVLVTREHSGGFEPLEDMGAEIIEFSTIEIVPPESYDELDRAINKIEAYNWIIFTSGNGVKYFFERLMERDKDIRDLRGIKICAIGTRTAAEIKKYGIRVDLIPEEFNAEGLIEAFLKIQNSKLKNQSLKGIKILLPRAEKAREIFPEKVRELGGEIDAPAAYRAVKPEMHGKRLKRFLREGRISIATFTSAATFNNFMEIMGADADELLRDVAIAVIGPVTAKAVEKAGLKIAIMPETATIEAMVEDIIKWAAKRQTAA